MLRQYETTFVIDAYLSNEQIEEKIQTYSKLIEENEGKIINIDRWGKRRLAYEIAKKQYGYYVYVRFEAPGTIVQIIERDYKLDDDIIRYLTVLVPKAAIKEEVRLQNQKDEAEKAKSEEADEEPVKAKAEAVVDNKPVEEEKKAEEPVKEENEEKEEA